MHSPVIYAVLTTSDLLKLSCGAGILQNFGLQGVSVNYDALNEEYLNVRITLCTSLTVFHSLLGNRWHCSGVLSRLCQAKSLFVSVGVLQPAGLLYRRQRVKKTFCRFKYLHGQQTTVSWATCCSRVTGRAALV
jgi:hypothetical protein